MATVFLVEIDGRDYGRADHDNGFSHYSIFVSPKSGKQRPYAKQVTSSRVKDKIDALINEGEHR
ncbi:hypothetical protein QMZ93_12295 [Pantoea stewartii subsp. indologenes]|uniref:hypothetical protein n=1 Tax=Pantoea TaxID=53335 RepID=UPI000D75D25B|nr:MULTISPECIES: hypothetical protein [Pantoea]MDK2634112.1 hypothetical protein [Pantoea stewartii subsp. indologenes]NRH25217.1 hypothetical protein [Pantoea stewartii]PXV73653.1 hypothetical protein C7433_106240 [Pantoea sp. PNA 03-3]